MSLPRFYEFGPFRLDSAERVLFREGRLLALPPKDVDTLLVLVQSGGQVVGKKELVEKVWPDTFVEEGNLARHVSNLRQALSEGGEETHYIETIPKRGYRFVAPVRAVFGAADGSDAWPEARPAARRRSWRLPAALGVAALAVIAAQGLSLWLTGERPVLSFASRDFILVTDFENHTGDPRFDRALLTAFTVSLEQSPHANVFPRSRAAAALQRMGKAGSASLDEALGREVCLREGIRGMVVCGITRTGQEYAVSVRLVDPQAATAVRSYTERARGEERILDALDALAGRIRRDLGESLQSIQGASRPLPRVTTSSLEALRLYADGQALWNKGRWDEAAQSWEAALQIDPDFAMAHKDLGSAYLSHVLQRAPNLGKGPPHLEKALGLSSRTTDRERSLIQATSLHKLGRYDEAMRVYDAYLKLYPDDSDTQFTAANLRMLAGNVEEALARFQEVLRVDPAHASAHINLANCLQMRGDYAQSLPHYARAFELEPARLSGNLIHEYGFALVATEQEDKARETFALALAKPPSKALGLRSLALLDLYHGKYRDSASKLRGAIALQADPGDALSRARNHLFLSMVLDGQGDKAGSRRELDRATSSLPDLPVWLAARVGAAYARQGAASQAMRALESVRKRADTGHREQATDLRLLEAEVELARGNAARAVELLESADREAPGQMKLLTIEPLARAYARAGRPDQSLAAYERIVATRAGWLGWETQFPRLQAYVDVAQAHFARGDEEKAREPLDRLLGLWKDADPDLPLLKEARALRQRLRKL